MVLFTLNIKKIKGAAHKNGISDDTCKQGFTATTQKNTRYNGNTLWLWKYIHLYRPQQ